MSVIKVETAINIAIVAAVGIGGYYLYNKFFGTATEDEVKKVFTNLPAWQPQYFENDKVKLQQLVVAQGKDYSGMADNMISDLSGLAITSADFSDFLNTIQQRMSSQSEVSYLSQNFLAKVNLTIPQFLISRIFPVVGLTWDNLKQVNDLVSKLPNLLP